MAAWAVDILVTDRHLVLVKARGKEKAKVKADIMLSRQLDKLTNELKWLDAEVSFQITKVEEV